MSDSERNDPEILRKFCFLASKNVIQIIRKLKENNVGEVKSGEKKKERSEIFANALYRNHSIFSLK